MPEALTQSQIDELLNRMKSGENIQEKSANKIKEYDFSSPKKFTKDQIKALGNLYENFSRVLSSYFTSILRSVHEVTVSQIEEQRYYEFSNALPDNTFIGMIDYSPQEDAQFEGSTMMFEMSSKLCFMIIDRLLGGLHAIEVFDRPYTEIELALLKSVMDRITRYLQDTWSNYFALTTELRSIETNGRLVQAYSPQDIVMIVSLEIKGEEGTMNANICMPAENLEVIINSFTGKYSHFTKKQDQEKEQAKRELLMQYLKKSDLVIEAVLDCCQMPFNQIAYLQVNDVLVLSKKFDEDILVNIEGIPWYTARLGESGKNKAIRIINPVEEAKEEGEQTYE